MNLSVKNNVNAPYCEGFFFAGVERAVEEPGVGVSRVSEDSAVPGDAASRSFVALSCKTKKAGKKKSKFKFPAKNFITWKMANKHRPAENEFLAFIKILFSTNKQEFCFIQAKKSQWSNGPTKKGANNFNFPPKNRLI
jgi:hypothetical protein